MYTIYFEDVMLEVRVIRACAGHFSISSAPGQQGPPGTPPGRGIPPLGCPGPAGVRGTRGAGPTVRNSRAGPLPGVECAVLTALAVRSLGLQVCAAVNLQRACYWRQTHGPACRSGSGNSLRADHSLETSPIEILGMSYSVFYSCSHCDVYCFSPD